LPTGIAADLVGFIDGSVALWLKYSPIVSYVLSSPYQAGLHIAIYIGDEG